MGKFESNEKFTGRRKLLGSLASSLPAAALLGMSAKGAEAAPAVVTANVPEALFAPARLRSG